MGDDLMNRKNRTGGIDNMRKVFVLVLATLIVMLTMAVIFTNVALANVTDADYINITVEEAKQMMDGNQSIVTLDVRILAEYKLGHIDGSKLIPLLELEERINAVDGNSAVIVYCGSGVKSEKASKILLDHGFDKVYNIRGGLNAWQNAGFFVVSGSTANQITPSNDSLSSEIEDILSSGKPVFLFLYVDWCHFCQQQIPIIDELEQEYNGKITFIRVNCEMHPDAMTDLEARGYPSMFLILRKGDDGQYESQYFKGFTDKEILKKSIDMIMTNGCLDESISLSVLGGFGSVGATHNSPCFPDTCVPNNDGCIGPSYPCSTDPDCSDDGWYCCGPKSTDNPLEETFYRDYFCNSSNQCDYTITNAADCDEGDLGVYCEGDIRKHKDCNCAEGDIIVACLCITISKRVFEKYQTPLKFVIMFN